MYQKFKKKLLSRNIDLFFDNFNFFFFQEEMDLNSSVRVVYIFFFYTTIKLKNIKFCRFYGRFRRRYVMIQNENGSGVVNCLLANTWGYNEFEL